jgi:GNAT superfamily N-acetyltransferase
MDQTEKWELSNGFVVVLAEAGDVDALLTMLNDVDDWLRGRGIEPGVPPRPMRDILIDRIASAKCYLAWEESRGEIVGTITLEWEDDGVWSDRDSTDDACYVHGLASRRDSAGRGIGLALLRWAEGQARAGGKKYLRLDCNGNNRALRAYYTERAELTYCGDVNMPTHFASRFEKRLEG